MAVFYVFFIIVALFMIWLVYQRRWKTFFWVAFSIVLLVIGGWFSLLYMVSIMGREKCEDKRRWVIEDYVIVEKSCIGFAGGYFNQVFLYFDNNEVDRIGAIQDSTCKLKFYLDKGDTLHFDICEMKLDLKKAR